MRTKRKKKFGKNGGTDNPTHVVSIMKKKKKQQVGWSLDTGDEIEFDDVMRSETVGNTHGGMMIDLEENRAIMEYNRAQRPRRICGVMILLLVCSVVLLISSGVICILSDGCHSLSVYGIMNTSHVSPLLVAGVILGTLAFVMISVSLYCKCVVRSAAVAKIQMIFCALLCVSVLASLYLYSFIQNNAFVWVATASSVLFLVWIWCAIVAMRKSIYVNGYPIRKAQLHCARFHIALGILYALSTTVYIVLYIVNADWWANGPGPFICECASGVSIMMFFVAITSHTRKVHLSFEIVK